MSEFSNAAIKDCVDYLISEIRRSGRSPRDAEGAEMHAVHTWMQDCPAPTPWQFYDVDGYKFSIRRGRDGRVITAIEL